MAGSWSWILWKRLKSVLATSWPLERCLLSKLKERSRVSWLIPPCVALTRPALSPRRTHFRVLTTSGILSLCIFTLACAQVLRLTSSQLTKRFEFATQIRDFLGSPSRRFKVQAVVGFFTAFALLERTSRPSGSSALEAFSFALCTFGRGFDMLSWAAWATLCCFRTRRSLALQRA